MASILPEKTVRNPHFLCRTENTRYRSRRTEGSAMPGDCHTERTVPGDALNGNAGADIKPKIDFRVAAFAAGRNAILFHTQDVIRRKPYDSALHQPIPQRL